MKYKVGDRVKIKDYEYLVKECKIGNYFASHIACKTLTIKNIDNESCEFIRDDSVCFHIYTSQLDKIIDEIEYNSIKNDRKDEKIMMDLLPWPELEEIAKVYTAGAKKYGPNKWQNLPDGYQRYKGAMLRHLTEVEKGNEIDQETGCLHIAQVAWNAIAMLHCKMEEMKPHSEKIPENANYIDK